MAITIGYRSELFAFDSRGRPFDRRLAVAVFPVTWKGVSCAREAASGLHCRNGAVTKRRAGVTKERNRTKQGRARLIADLSFAGRGEAAAGISRVKAILRRVVKHLIAAFAIAIAGEGGEVGRGWKPVRGRADRLELGAGGDRDKLEGVILQQPFAERGARL